MNIMVLFSVYLVWIVLFENINHQITSERDPSIWGNPRTIFEVFYEDVTFLEIPNHDKLLFCVSRRQCGN